MPMVKYKIKTLSNISSKGLMALSQSSCSIDDDCKDPDGILIRSTNEDPENAVFLNAYLPHMLLKLANKINAKLIHFSTDCVFSGN